MENKIKLIDLKDHFEDKIDLFICSSSFEDRCFSIARQVAKMKTLPKKVLICFNSNEYKKIIENSLELRKLFPKKPILLELSSSQPLKNGVSLNDTLDNILTKDKISNIFLDTTTFTHETLLVVIRLLVFKREYFKQLFIGYVGANNYSINEKDVKDKWLSIGISEIRSVLGYPGSLSPARKYHLIILFGFELERTRKIIEDYEFDKVSIAFGNQSIAESHRELNYSRHKELLEIYPYAEAFEVSLIDPNIAKDQLLNQAHKYSTYNTLVAPMNTKLSTVGSALAAIEDPKIQLIYAKAIKYNSSGYSTPKDECFIYKII